MNGPADFCKTGVMLELAVDGSMGARCEYWAEPLIDGLLRLVLLTLLAGVSGREVRLKTGRLVWAGEASWELCRRYSGFIGGLDRCTIGAGLWCGAIEGRPVTKVRGRPDD
jgi:hypothetical protein